MGAVKVDTIRPIHKLLLHRNSPWSRRRVNQLPVYTTLRISAWDAANSRAFLNRSYFVNQRIEFNYVKADKGAGGLAADVLAPLYDRVRVLPLVQAGGTFF